MSLAKEILLKKLRNILRQWPVDATKKGRDLGEFFAEGYAGRLQNGDIPNVRLYRFNSTHDHTHSFSHILRLLKPWIALRS